MNTISSPFAKRAAELYAALPQSGDPELRANKAHEALDTLVSEFPTLPEADLGRLACQMAAKSSLPVDAYRRGLQEASQGIQGNGCALAGLAVDLLKAAPETSQDGMREAAYDMLQPRPDLEPTMCLGPVVDPSWWPHHHFTDQEAGRTHQHLLEAAHDGEKPRQSALWILCDNLEKGKYTGGWSPGSSEYDDEVSAGYEIHPESARDKTMAEGLLKAVLDRPLTEKTYQAAEQAIGHGGSPVEVAKTFLSRESGLANVHADTYTTAQGLARSVEDYTYKLPAYQEAAAAVRDQLRAQGDQAYKYLDILADAQLGLGGLFEYGAVGIHALQKALEKVTPDPQKVGPQQLAGFLADISEDRIGVSDGSCGHIVTPADLYPSLARRLALVAAHPGWAGAFQMLGEAAQADLHIDGDGGWDGQAAPIFKRLAELKPGQSPLLAGVAGASQLGVKYYEDEHKLMDAVLTAASKVAQDPHEVEVLGKGRELLESQGARAAKGYLASCDTLPPASPQAGAVAAP